MSIYQIWIPGEIGYKEHLDRQQFSNDNINAFKEAIHQQTKSITSQSKNIIASNEQIISSIDKGFERLAQINAQGFNQVTSAIEDLHSDMVFCFGVVIQKLEYQNSLLNSILSTLEEPFETKVKEYYRKGCLFVKQGFLEGAVDCFKESISLKMGEYFFPSYYQLGRIYLSGKEEGVNMVNVKSATTYLLKANEYGNRILKTDPSFNKILADCKFYLSQSYYYQLTGNANSSDLSFLMEAIKYCREAILLNPNLSQAIYHYAKYISYGIGNFKELNDDKHEKLLLESFDKVVRIDRNYLRSVINGDPLYDKAFESRIEKVNELIISRTNEKEKKADNLLSQARKFLFQLEDMNITYSENPNLIGRYNSVKNIIQQAESNFRTGTYFGFDDCETSIPAQNQLLNELVEERAKEIKLLHKKIVRNIAISIVAIAAIFIVYHIIVWIGTLSTWEIIGYFFLVFINWSCNRQSCRLVFLMAIILRCFFINNYSFIEIELAFTVF